MPIRDILKRSEVQLSLAVGILVTVLLLSQFGAYIAYGIPAVTCHTVSQTKPESKTVNILSSSGQWLSYEYSGSGEAHERTVTWSRNVYITLKARTNVKVEITDLALSGFLTEIKSPPFLIEETNTTLAYKNVTIHAYAYGFKLNIAWSGSYQVIVDRFTEEGTLVKLPWQPEPRSKEQMIQEILNGVLIPDYNSRAAYVAADLLMSIDAPTLATDKTTELRPDYLGMCGMWLIDYRTVGYCAGTAVEAVPQATGTAVRLYRDRDLTLQCWSPDYSTPFGNPLITPDAAYWLQNFAAQSGWWKTSIVNLGSQLFFDSSQPYPNYLKWAWEKGSSVAPAIAQWFRVDVAFRVTKDWIVPNIPDYELPKDIKEKMKIIIKTEPENQGVPISPPAEDIWGGILAKLTIIIVIVFVGIIVIIVVYYIAKRRIGKT